jgi:protein TonB
MLFAPRPGWTRPEGKVNEGGQVIALSLVEMPGEETPAPKTARPAAAPVAPPKRREPRMTEAPKPSMAMAAKPVIKEPAEPAAFRSAAAPEAAATGPEPAPGSIFTAQGSGPANAPPTGADQAQVRASVPLYDRNPAPVYPAAARRRNLEGMVLLSVLVDCEGKAAEVKLQRGSGHALLDGSALDSVRRWRFTPALRGGRPQEMWVQVPVRFELK